MFDIFGLEYQVRKPLAQRPGRAAIALAGLRFIIVMVGSIENAMVMGHRKTGVDLNRLAGLGLKLQAG